MLGADPRAARVGVHDDCFLASADDMGTFADPGDRAWLAQQSSAAPVGGETCGVDAPRSGFPTASSELAAFHWSFLNADYSTEVLSSWGEAGRQEVARRLGYRLRLVAASAPVSARPGATARLYLRLVNDGYAAPLVSRPVSVVLTQGTRSVAVPVPVRLRSLTPGVGVTVGVDVRVPTTPGAWSLSLLMPDPSAALAGDPAYAIRLADEGTWDPATGRNMLRLAIAVA